jgi:uncharacterized protein (TIGR03905 family)
MRHTYNTQGTCSTKIEFDLNDGIVSNVVFTGGCDGNLKAIPKLVEGMTVEKINDKLRGIRCGLRPTSCADQLAKAVREA